MKKQFLLLVVGGALLSGCDDPFAPDPTRSFTVVATGGDHSCAVTTTGDAYCWGRGSDGELGTGDIGHQFAPARVESEEEFATITTGDAHTCALTTDGRAFCWGWNAFYQRGNSTDGRNSVPVAVSTAIRFKAISAGAHHTCAIAADDVVYCWGNNRYGQSGNGSTNTIIEPEAVAGRFRANQISAGAWHTCAVSGGAGYCWGRNDSGQLGIASPVLLAAEPTLVRTAISFKQISGGRTHSCAVGQDGLGYCWGGNLHGQLGDGGAFRDGLVGASAPQAVVLLSNLATIAAGSDYTCAISTSPANAWCWGRGEFGQLANGNSGDRYVRQPVHLQPGGQHTSELLTFSALSINGATHGCGISDGSIYCWGMGQLGQLGADTRLQSFLPQRTR